MTDETTQSSLLFDPSTPVLIFGLLLLAATGFLCVWAWKRSGWAKGVGLLELLRFAIVGLVVLTLFQPEWRELSRPDTKPTIAVLWDQSRSMETADVLDEENAGQEPKKRSAAIAPLLKEQAWWPLGNSVRTVIEPFSSRLDPAWEGTDLHEALDRVLAQHPQLRGVVLFTDGDWNVGDPPIRAATKLRMRNVPVFAVPVGSEVQLPDLELVRLDAPTFGVSGKPLRIPFEIASSLPREFNADIELVTSTGETVTKTLTIPAMGRIQDTLSWTPEQTGDVELTLRVPEGPNEFLKENNVRSAPISIREEQLRVLLIESYPRWEYRYLRNALERDPGVEISCLLFHPDLGKTGGGRGYISAFPNDEDLVSYDVVFLGDVGVAPDQLTLEQCKRLVQLVRNQASGLVFLPGFRGRHYSLLETELADLYPVVLDETQLRGWGSPVPGQFQLTEVGNRSLLTKLDDSDAENYRVWESLPGFQWFAASLRAKAGTEVLATHSSEATEFGRVPLIVTKTFGAGKVLFMGTDGAWRWREGVEDKYHYRFWGQVARWMAYQRNMAQGELMRLFYSPDRPQSNEVLTLNANVISLGGDPLQEANVVVQFISPSGKTGSVRLSPGGEDAWGLFTGRFTPTEPGQYQVIMTCRENGATLETTLSVQGGKRERLGRPVRTDVLAEIARVTRGEVMKTLEMDTLLEAVQSLPDPEPIERRFRLWAHWMWGTLLVGMMGAFWVGRKVIGVV